MIKSDRWIRRMALEHRMIEPFEPGQIRQANGHKIVSYGTSSYGYDMRCSSEFKLFTDINTTIVDPKNFDEKSFVDIRGDSCIIPPNSFVTLEFSNTTPLPARIYANEGVAQVIFFESDEPCETSYKDRGGKYQGQQGVTLPKI